jgi:exodeoxyribonuclease-3
MTRIISYNVNGIRAAATKGLMDWVGAEQPDVLCLQETKAQPDQLDATLLQPAGYHTYWHSAQKKGYSGVAIFSKKEPLHVETGCGIDWIDAEGRVLRADYEDFSVMSLYVPSGSSGEDRQGMKEVFMRDFPDYLRGLLTTHPRLIVCGDFNVAHEKIDIHDPVGNKNSSGFLPHEREWFGQLLGIGFKDAFRHLHPDEKHAYTWWSYRFNARANNKGWRIDYHLVSDALASTCEAAAILPDAKHSDHCPIDLHLS